MALESGNLRSGCQQGCVLMNTSFTACGWLPSHCVLRGQGERGREGREQRKEGEESKQEHECPPVSDKGTDPIARALSS